MNWVIASLPFWFLGGATAVIAVASLWSGIINRPSDEAVQIYTGFAVLMLIAGASGSLAAWMSS